MRRIDEFKSYRSTIDYDVATGQFIVTPVAEYFAEVLDEESLNAEIVKFPAPRPAAQEQRKAG